MGEGVLGLLEEIRAIIGCSCTKRGSCYRIGKIEATATRGVGGIIRVSRRGA
jgi:hypothetical protein